MHAIKMRETFTMSIACKNRLLIHKKNHFRRRAEEKEGTKKVYDRNLGSKSQKDCWFIRPMFYFLEKLH